MLSLRLSSVASFVSQGAIVADIGSDHAYLPCALVNEGKVAKAYACEVKDGPLQASMRTIRSRQLENQVIPVLSDGLCNVPGDVTEVVIAGMGVHTILSILQTSKPRLKHFHRIIVQANQNVELLREFISQNEYKILEETMVFEEKFYEVVVFEAKNGRTLSDLECYFGPCLIKEQSKIFRSFYVQRYQTLSNIILSLSDNQQRYHELRRELDLIVAGVPGVSEVKS